MIEYNAKKNLLEQSMYTYELQDVPDPNLYREIYEYTEIPKIAFNYRSVPISMPADIWITDTTFRDGQQSMSPFTVEQIVHLYKLMSKLGGPKGIIRQTEFFVYTDKDKEALRKCQELGLRFPAITTWIRANEKDFTLVKEMGVRETGILVSCSDYHIFKKMHMTRGQAMEQYLRIVKAALDEDIRPRCHFEDITRADFYGFVVPFVSELRRLSIESGIPIKIRACDTLGLGLNFSGVALPRSVPGIMYGLHHYARVPSEYLEWHGHNDFYMVVANACAAWLYGCAAVNCTLLGIGERTGNCPLEAMALQYAALRGTRDGMDFSAITEIVEYFENEIGFMIPPRTPFAGRSFNSTRAGIHADGLLKDEEIYNIFDTAEILGRPVHVAVDAHSGAAGITHWIKSYYKLKDDTVVDKRSDIVLRIKERVDALYADGRNTVMGDLELEQILVDEDPEMHELLSWHKKGVI